MKPVGRSYFQLSLRVAFLLLTAGCITLGILAARVERQRAAVSAILRAGGHINYGHKLVATSKDQELTTSIVPAWAVRLLGDDWFYHVEGVTLYGESCSDDTLRHVATLTDLKGLALWPWGRASTTDLLGGKFEKGLSAGVTDGGLSILKDHPSLEHISFLGNQISDAGLEHLKTLPRLKEIQVTFDTSQVTPEGYEDLMATIARRERRP